MLKTLAEKKALNDEIAGGLDKATDEFRQSFLA